MKISSNSLSMKLNLGKSQSNNTTKIQEKVVSYSGEVDYETNVINKPTFNGKELVGDVVEDDPNMQAISLEELNNMFNSIFK